MKSLQSISKLKMVTAPEPKQAIEILSPALRIARANQIMFHNPCENIKIKLPKTKKSYPMQQNALKEKGTGYFFLFLSNSQNSNIQKWSAYIRGSTNRQQFLEKALKWVSKDRIEDYMGRHRYDNSISELRNYFTSVIDWVFSIFTDVEREMCGLEWGRLYETFHKQPYNPQKVSEEIKKLFGDPYIKNGKGIFEYILGGSIESKLLEVRVFDEATKKSIHSKQTTEAKTKGISNCPLCAIRHDANKSKIWNLPDMDADHVTAWSKGGATDVKNCQMLCKTPNRAKENRE